MPETDRLGRQKQLVGIARKFGRCRRKWPCLEADTCTEPPCPARVRFSEGEAASLGPFTKIYPNNAQLDDAGVIG